ncbi:hypothetical protein BC831DRAFT_466680, partial [Entophlyctis helioformis]
MLAFSSCLALLLPHLRLCLLQRRSRRCRCSRCRIWPESDVDGRVGACLGRWVSAWTLDMAVIVPRYIVNKRDGRGGDMQRERDGRGTLDRQGQVGCAMNGSA